MRLLPLVLCLAPFAAFAEQPTPREIAARVRPALVLISSVNDGEVSGHGSGFIVSEDGRIVTNRHVIEGAGSLRVQLATGEIYDNVYFISDDERRDLAILRIPETGLPALPIGDDRQTAVGDRVYVMGNPMGLEGTFSDGLIAAMRTIDGVAMLQITAPISTGSSGGPVLNEAGEVIGVATLTMEEGQNLNLAVPARYAKGLMAMNEDPQPFATVASRFATAGPSFGGSSLPAPTSDMEPWMRVLTEEMRVLHEAAVDLGYGVTHEPTIGMLKKRDTHTFEQTFSRKGADVKMIGACDIDCSNLDMAIYDLEGNPIAKDTLDDDRPELDFTITKPGQLRVVVYMAECSREPCGFGVQTFERND